MHEDEIQALRRIATILGRVSTPEERRNISLRVEQRISGQDTDPLAFSLRHAAALFFPGDASRTQAVRERMNAAFAAGELVTRIPKGHRHVMLSDLAVWPDCPPMATDSPLRYLLPDCPVEIPPTLPQAEAPKHDYSMLATPEKLIEAFGIATSMNTTWFRSLKDRPGLKNAREIAGKGGKNGYPPLFRVIDVFRYLTTPRRGAAALSEDLAWRLLKRYFPLVYVKYSIGDAGSD